MWLKVAGFDYLLVSQEEMIGLLEDTPWTVSQFIEGENGRYVAILEKKESLGIHGVRDYGQM